MTESERPDWWPESVSDLPCTCQCGQNGYHAGVEAGVQAVMGRIRLQVAVEWPGFPGMIIIGSLEWKQLREEAGLDD